MDRIIRPMGWYEEAAPSPDVPPNIATSFAVEADGVPEHLPWDDEADQEAGAGELADVALHPLQLTHLRDTDREEASLDGLRSDNARGWVRG